MLKPQGPKKPAAMPEPVPTACGDEISALSALAFEGWVAEVKTNWLSFGKSAKRSTAVSARKSCCVRERVEAEVVDVAGAEAVLVLDAEVVALRPYGCEGAASEVEAKMAAAMIGVKSILRD